MKEKEANAILGTLPIGVTTEVNGLRIRRRFIQAGWRQINKFAIQGKDKELGWRAAARALMTHHNVVLAKDSTDGCQGKDEDSREDRSRSERKAGEGERIAPEIGSQEKRS